MRTKRTWIVAADGGVARIFEQAETGGEVAELIEKTMRASVPPKPHGRAPRVHDRLGPARQAIEKRVDPRAAVEHLLLESVAERILR